jgi:hypothetical protein
MALSEHESADESAILLPFGFDQIVREIGARFQRSRV